MPSGAATSHPGHSEGRKVVFACVWGRLWRGLVKAVCRGCTGWLPRGGVSGQLRAFSGREDKQGLRYISLFLAHIKNPFLTVLEERLKG